MTGFAFIRTFFLQHHNQKVRKTSTSARPPRTPPIIALIGVFEPTWGAVVEVDCVDVVCVGDADPGCIDTVCVTAEAVGIDVVCVAADDIDDTDIDPVDTDPVSIDVARVDAVCADAVGVDLEVEVVGAIFGSTT